MENIKQTSIDEYVEKVLAWSQDRCIIPNSTATAQFMKAVSEMGELSDAITKNDVVEIRDGIGDVIVCLINLAALSGMTIQECLEKAYCDIRHRKGRMNENGVFVKEG